MLPVVFAAFAIIPRASEDLAALPVEESNCERASSDVLAVLAEKGDFDDVAATTVARGADAPATFPDATLLSITVRC